MTPSVAVRFALTGCLTIGILAASPTPVQAQARTQTQGKVGVLKWEFEVHGAFATGYSAPEGQSKGPSEGPSFTLGDGTTPSKAVTSWYFGSGASFLNQVLALRGIGINDRVTALDSGGWPSAGRRPGVQFGARIARRVTNTIWIEISADLGLDPLGFDSDTEARIEQTRASFVSAFTALNNSTLTLMPNPTVTSTATVQSGGRRLVTSGVVQYRGTGTGTRPYVFAGVGLATPIGGATSLTLTGRYQFSTPGGAAFDETDAMVLRYHSTMSFVTVAGFGFMRDLSPRSGYRVETRVMFGTAHQDIRLDTEPVVTVTAPTGAAILNATSPGLQFATNGLRTNLSAQATRDFAALTANGKKLQWVISAGYFWRF
jgi:hypothetical protein